MRDLWKAFERHRRSELASIAGGALAILAMLVPLITDKFTPQWATKEFFSMFLALLFLLLGDRISNFFRSIENSESISEITEAISTPISQFVAWKHIGTYRDALKYLQSRVLFAERIKDISVAYGLTSNKEMELYFYKRTSRIHLPL